MKFNFNNIKKIVHISPIKFLKRYLFEDKYYVMYSCKTGYSPKQYIKIRIKNDRLIISNITNYICFIFNEESKVILNEFENIDYKFDFLKKYIKQAVSYRFGSNCSKISPFYTVYKAIEDLELNIIQKKFSTWILLDSGDMFLIENNWLYHNKVQYQMKQITPSYLCTPNKFQYVEIKPESYKKINCLKLTKDNNSNVESIKQFVISCLEK